MIELARVKRNGAKSIREIVECFKSQSNVFECMTMHDMIQTVRSYKQIGLLVITDTELILNHYC